MSASLTNKLINKIRKLISSSAKDLDLDQLLEVLPKFSEWLNLCTDVEFHSKWYLADLEVSIDKFMKDLKRKRTGPISKIEVVLIKEKKNEKTTETSRENSQNRKEEVKETKPPVVRKNAKSEGQSKPNETGISVQGSSQDSIKKKRGRPRKDSI